jgi:hypothetical protein
VLLPGGLLPLHVFEPRYRELTRDCLAGHHLMGVARLRPGYEAEYHARPPVYEKCGVGRIRIDTALDNGLAFWVSGDNLWKGAALNALQNAELMVQKGWLKPKKTAARELVSAK